MELSTVAALTQAFIKFVGVVLSNLKCREIATVDVELINLERSRLTETLDTYRLQVGRAVEQDKSHAVQSLISRGLNNTTIRDQNLRAIDLVASNELECATREYNRAIEEIALLERKIKERACPWWMTLWRYFTTRGA